MIYQAMEMRRPKTEDLARLKVIWKKSFGEKDTSIDFYFNNRSWKEEMMVFMLDKTIVSMLAMIPTTMMEGDGSRYEAAMLYAVATHPDYQRRGLANMLLEYSNQYLQAKEIPFTMLVPAKDELFEFYGKRGYKTEFYIREAILSCDEIEEMNNSNPCRCDFYPVNPKEYNEIRRKLLTGLPHVDYREEEISFQKKESQLYGGDIYRIVRDQAVGCAAMERISPKEVLIKELLLPEPYLASAVKAIPQIMPGDQYNVRTPPSFGTTLGGIIRPFGMIRSNKTTVKTARREEGNGAYLGIAYD